MKHRLGLILALLLPISILAGNAWFHHQQRESGEQVIFPIQGFDPRDLLSGHYLVYQVDYGLENNNACPASDIAAFACLQPERRIYPLDELPASCEQFIRGDCDSNARFVTGLERFYIPEQYAGELDKVVRDHRGQLVVSVDKSGNTAIRDLLIDDRPWKEVVTKGD